MEDYKKLQKHVREHKDLWPPIWKEQILRLETANENTDAFLNYVGQTDMWLDKRLSKTEDQVSSGFKSQGKNRITFAKAVFHVLVKDEESGSKRRREMRRRFYRTALNVHLLQQVLQISRRHLIPRYSLPHLVHRRISVHTPGEPVGKLERGRENNPL